MVTHRRTIPRFFPVLLLLLAWGVMSFRADKAFMGHHDANGIWLGAAARNLALYGPGEIGWVPILNRGPLLTDDLTVYINHPPLVVWASAGALVLFGGDELSLRWVSMASTLVTIAGFYVLCRRLFGDRRAFLIAALFTLTPMILYFGRMPNHEPLSLAFLMPLGAMLVKRGGSGGFLRRVSMIGLAILAIWTAWASVFFVAAFAAVGWRCRRGTDRRWMVALGATAVVTPPLIIAFYMTQYAGTIERLAYAWVTRTSNVVNADAVRSVSDIPFTWGDYMVTTLVHLLGAATVGILVLAAFGWYFSLREPDRRRPLMLCAFAAGGLAYILVFRQVSYLHDYYKIYLMPALAIGAHYTVIRGWNHPRAQRVLRPILIGLLVPSLSFGAALMLRWINTSDDYVELRLAAHLAAEVMPDESVFTNLPFNPPIEYYAHRRMVVEVTRAEADAQVTGRAVYFECAWVEPDLSGVEIDPQNPSAGCVLTRLADRPSVPAP